MEHAQQQATAHDKQPMTELHSSACVTTFVHDKNKHVMVTEALGRDIWACSFYKACRICNMISVHTLDFVVMGHSRQGNKAELLLAYDKHSGCDIGRNCRRGSNGRFCDGNVSKELRPAKRIYLWNGKCML